MTILSDIKERILILDGSMGALLQNRGLPPGYAPDLWNLENSTAIGAVHAEYAKAGADIVITNTFGASKIRLEEYKAYDKLVEINRSAVEIARGAAPGKYVAGDVGPLGGIMAPAGDINFDTGLAIFREQISALVEAGVDLIMIETMFDLMEMKAAVIAANEVRGNIPLLASMTFTGDGLTDTGTDAETAAVTLEALGVDILAVNCSVGPAPMVDVVARMGRVSSLPIAVQPNAGMPKNVGGATVFEMSMEELAGYARSFVDAGAVILGGCCGTTPEYTRMISSSLKEVKPKIRNVKRRCSITSRMQTHYIGEGEPFLKIGEKINPTGRKKFGESIKQGKFNLVLADARKQYESGATALDVNVGVPLTDEADNMAKVIAAVQNVVPIPLVIDSSYSSALEAGLKVYPGKALVNSVNGEAEKIEEVAPLVKKYGAGVIALLSADDIPEKAVDRLKVAIGILEELEKYGIPKEMVVFDCLALVVSAMQNGARETLETIRLVKKELGCPTVAGVSNVSFGLPQRKIINNTFLAMAMANGMDGGIVNPYDEVMNRTVLAAQLFSGRDEACAQFIPAMENVDADGGGAGGAGTATEPKEPMGTLEAIGSAVIEGDRDSIEGLTQKALDEGHEAMDIFVGNMTPAIRKLGELFAQRKKFIPHLVASADTMKRGVAVLDPILKAGKGKAPEKGNIIFATVKGDIHDIGKNVCVIMLENFGFNVVDLGRNVPLEDILEAAKQNRADIIALSALMTTTMMQMKVATDTIREKSLPYKVMVGGAVVTRSFADEIGADAYGKSVGDVVPVTESLMEAIKEK